MSFGDCCHSFPPSSPPHNIPILGFLFVAIHTCVYCAPPLPAIASTPLPDAHKMGLSGKTFEPHISHEGSLWPITVLMEARDSPQLHAFSPTACVDGGQGSARPVSVVLSLATPLPPPPPVQRGALSWQPVSKVMWFWQVKAFNGRRTRTNLVATSHSLCLNSNLCQNPGALVAG